MTTSKRILNTPRDTAQLISDIKGMELPLTIAIKDGADRTLAQNRLVNGWYADAANWLGDIEAWQVRAECKLNIGVKMLVTEDDTFREKWHRMIMDRYTYEEKLEFMSEPWDFPVTRLMSKPQMSRYMNAVWDKYRPQGVPLTDPEMRGIEAMQR